MNGKMSSFMLHFFQFRLLWLVRTLFGCLVTMNWLAGSEAQVRSYPTNEECEYHTCNFSSLPSDDSDRGV